MIYPMIFFDFLRLFFHISFVFFYNLGVKVIKKFSESPSKGKKSLEKGNKSLNSQLFYDEKV